MKSLKGQLFVKENFCVRLKEFRKGLFFRGSLFNWFFFYQPKKKFKKECSWGREKYNKENAYTMVRKFQWGKFLRGILLRIFFKQKKQKNVFKEEQNCIKEILELKRKFGKLIGWKRKRKKVLFH